MPTESYTFKLQTTLPLLICASLLLLPAFVFAEGEGGGEGGGADLSDNNIEGVEVSLGGYTSVGTVTGVSHNQGSWSGTYNGISVSFNSAAKSWEGSYSGVGESYGNSTGGTNQPSSSYSAGYVVNQTCVDRNNVDVTLQGPHIPDASGAGWAGLYDSVRPPQNYRGLFKSGEVKTLRYPAGASYPEAMWAYTYWNGDYYLNDYKVFSFNVRNDCAPPPPSVSLNANPSQVEYNHASTLTWSSVNTVSCSASGGWSGNRALNNASGQSTGPLTAATTFALTCQGQSGTTPARSERTVTVRIGVGADITTDNSIVRKNEEIDLDWNVGTSLPENCEVRAGSNSLTGPLTATSGTLTHQLTGETIFTLFCDGGQNQDSVTVKVLPEFQET